MKQKLSKKLKTSGGFTLIEMLIVVAIIAILVAVSIPMVNTSLEKTKNATDAANERAAKSAALIRYMEDGASGTYHYDAAAGLLKSSSEQPAGYGQCKHHKGDYIVVKIDAQGIVTVEWSGNYKTPHNGSVD